MVDTSSGRKKQPKRGFTAVRSLEDVWREANAEKIARNAGAAHYPTVRDAITRNIEDTLKYTGAPAHQARGMARPLTEIAETVTPAGMITSAQDAQEAAGQGNYAMAGLAAAGAFPGGGGNSIKDAGRLWKIAHGEAPIFKADLFKNKLRQPLQDYHAQYEDIPGAVLPPKPFDPASYMGQWMIPAIGDRTIAGKRLLGIGDMKFENPVDLQGGPNFMRGPQQQADSAAWASDKGVITKLNKKIKRLGEDGTPVNLVYSAMGGRSGDFADMTAKTIREQLKQTKIAKADKASFDEAMREKDPKFPGIDNLTDEWMGGKAENRKKFVELMAEGRFQQKGFPDVAAARFAVTEPDLVNAPWGVTGYNIAKVTGENIKNPSVPHTTYPIQTKGVYDASSEVPIPRGLMFSDFSRSRPVGESTPHNDRAFLLKPVAQKVDQQWVDNMSTFNELARGHVDNFDRKVDDIAKYSGMSKLDVIRRIIRETGQ